MARLLLTSLARACCECVILIPSIHGWIASKCTASLASASGLDGGASGVFPPEPGDEQQAFLELVRRDPHQCGEPHSRWTLQTIRHACTPVQSYSLSGIWRMLQRCDIHWKRGRDHIYSPDPHYEPKLARLAEIRQRIARPGSSELLLFLDELTYYRQPTLACAYEQAGRTQPLAERSYRSNTPTRVVAALNGLTGEVAHHQANLIGVQELIHFYEFLCQHYPSAQRIFVVQDNWPVHFHPDVLLALEPQENPWPWVLPANWTKQPSAKARRLNLPVQILPLPTYAPWTNPVEKLWRWLKQDVLHLHRLADDLTELRRQVAGFLDQFAPGSHALLRYVGLLVPN